MSVLTPILKSLRLGKMIVLRDDKNREDEGDLLIAAEKVTPRAINFMATFGRGLICVPLTHERAATLELVPMTRRNTAPLKCNFTISVDAKRGVTTGISAFDRARTIRALASSRTKSRDLVAPGHVFPLVASSGGLRTRRGHTEGAVELLEAAHMTPVAAICEIMSEDGRMLRGNGLNEFARVHGLHIISIADIPLREKNKPSSKSGSVLKRCVAARVPTQYGLFKATIYTTFSDVKEHIALVKGRISSKSKPLVRIHSECLTGDTFGSTRCDCHSQLEESLKRIGTSKCGVFLYMRHEGRGIGLINKLRAYNLQDRGMDTVEANNALGFEADERDHSLAAEILSDLGVRSMHLMTNNPDKIKAFATSSVRVISRVPLESPVKTTAERLYLGTKKKKMGHLLTHV